MTDAERFSEPALDFFKDAVVARTPASQIPPPPPPLVSSCSAHGLRDEKPAALENGGLEPEVNRGIEKKKKNENERQPRPDHREYPPLCYPAKRSGGWGGEEEKREDRRRKFTGILFCKVIKGGRSLIPSAC